MARDRSENAPYGGRGIGALLAAQPMFKAAGTALTVDRTLSIFAAVYVYEGGGFFEDATGGRRDVSAGDLLLLLPGVKHSYGPDGRQDWKEFFLLFDGPVFGLWRERGLLDAARPVIRLTPVERWLARFRALGQAVGSETQRVCLLQQLLAEVCEPDPASEEGWVARARHLLEADPSQTPDLRQVAGRVGVSYDHFRKRFKQVVGIPPGQYRGVRAVNQARLLLQTTPMTIQQVAEATGFCDVYYFSRRFKQVTGRSPGAYRRSHGGANAVDA